jgi:Uma2 family endonuclease
MSAAGSLARVSDAPRDDQVVVLSGATWADYRRLLEVRGESAVPRITYQKGVLQIMSPSSRHERVKSVLNLLVTVYCLEAGIEFTPFGAWTLADEEGEHGLEPDECYVLGPEREAMRPDLAIEVVLTSGTIRKLDVYRALGVPEVWF